MLAGHSLFRFPKGKKDAEGYDQYIDSQEEMAK
jgi:hypothetical protein